MSPSEDKVTPAPYAQQAYCRRESDHDKTPERLAYLATALVFFVTASLLYRPLPEGAHDILYLIVGQLVVGWLMALGYYYSTTANAKSKDKMLANSVPVSSVKEGV